MKRRYFLGLLLLPHVVLAHSFKLGAIEIGHAWGLPTDESKTSVMMPMFNTATEADVLLGATSSIAQSIELLDGETRVDGFRLEPSRPFPMRAVAKHLQLTGLAKPLVKGDKLQLTLTFKFAGQISIDVYIADKAGE